MSLPSKPLHTKRYFILVLVTACILFAFFQYTGHSIIEDLLDFNSQTDADSYTAVVNGQAVLIKETRRGVKVEPIKTSLPVDEAFGISKDGVTLLYSPVKDGVPSAELYIENITTGVAQKISHQLVLYAAWSPTNPNKVAYTFGGNSAGLAVTDLASQEEKVLVSDYVLSTLIQWDGAGEGIYYYQSFNEDHPDDGLIPYFVSAETGEPHEVLNLDALTGFPNLRSAALPSGLFPRTAEETNFTDNPDYFRMASPDRSYEVIGNSLLGPGTLYARPLPLGEPKVLGRDMLLKKVMRKGVVVRVFSDIGSELKYVRFDGLITTIKTDPAVDYKLPFRGSRTVTQGGENYPAPANSCNIHSHFTSRGLGYAYDLQGSPRAQVLASASGRVVSVTSTVRCNSLDDGSDGTPCRGRSGYSKRCDRRRPISNFGWGNTVIIKHASDEFTKYAHLEPNSIRVTDGSVVCQGAYIAQQGHTGNTVGRSPKPDGCGDHLHFQSQAVKDLDGLSIEVRFSNASYPLPCEIISSDTERLTTCSEILAPNPFYDPRLANMRFGEPVVDSQGRLLVAGVQGDSSFRVNSISPQGKLNWQTDQINGSNFVVFPSVLLGPNNSVYFNPGLSTLYAFNSNGTQISGWPVNLTVPGGAFPRVKAGPIVDERDGTMYLKAGFVGAFAPSNVAVIAFNLDGREKWRREYSSEPVSGYGMIQGPARNIYAFIGKTLIGLDRGDGTQLCQIPTEAFFRSLIAGPDNVFTSFHLNITAHDVNCVARNTSSPPGRDVQLRGFAQGVLFGVDYPGTDFQGARNPNDVRLVAISKDETLVWRNDEIVPRADFPPPPLDNSIRAVRNNMLYVIGQHLTDGNKPKLFLVNATSGQIINSLETTNLCLNCGVAVAPDGTIYLNDLNSTKIYKLN